MIPRSRFRSLHVSLAAALASGLLPLGASAANVTWNKSTNNWSSAAAWGGTLPGGVNAQVDTAILPGGQVTLNDASADSSSLIGDIGMVWVTNGTVVLHQTNGVLRTATGTYDLTIGSGARYLMSGGTADVSRTIYVNSGFGGTYGLELSGGYVTNGSGLTVANGAGLTGAVLVTGGSVQLGSGNVRVGYLGGFGRLVVSNGVINPYTQRSPTIGENGGTGVMEIYGGSNRWSSLSVGAAGNSAAGTGTVVLAGGVLTVGSNLRLGSGGTVAGSMGALSQSNGTLTVLGGDVSVAFTNGATGRFEISGGSFTQASSRAFTLGASHLAATGSLHVIGSGASSITLGNFTMGSNGSQTLRLTLDGSATGLTPLGVNAAAFNQQALLVDLSGLAPQADLLLMDYASLASGNAGLFGGLTNGAGVSASFGASTYFWNLNYAFSGSAANGTGDGSAVGLVFDHVSVIPEPTPVLLLLGSAALMAWRRRPRG
jgi:fibronectin-binding autotransporter adhesin